MIIYLLESSDESVFFMVFEINFFVDSVFIVVFNDLRPSITKFDRWKLIFIDDKQFFFNFDVSKKKKINKVATAHFLFQMIAAINEIYVKLELS